LKGESVSKLCIKEMGNLTEREDKDVLCEGDDGKDERDGVDTVSVDVVVIVIVISACYCCFPLLLVSMMYCL
jgi:hypothetical protein